VSISIGSRAAPPVGWFPLAPREVYVPSYRHSPRYVQNVNITQVTNVTVINQAVQRPPAQYVNRQVFNAVTVVPADVLKERKPVAPAIMRGREAQQVVQQSNVKHEAPVTAPVIRAVNVAPGVAAVPPPPGHPGRGSEYRRDQEERGRRGGEGQRLIVPPRETNVQAQPPTPQAPTVQRPATPVQPAVTPPQAPVMQAPPHLPRGEPQREERPQREDKPQRGWQRAIDRDAQREAPRAEPPRVVQPQAQPQPQPQPQPQVRGVPPQPQPQQPQAQPEGRKQIPPRPPEGRGREAAAERQPEASQPEQRAQERHKERDKDRADGRRERAQQQNN
jgi:hypothetical protein